MRISLSNVCSKYKIDEDELKQFIEKADYWYKDGVFGFELNDQEVEDILTEFAPNRYAEFFPDKVSQEEREQMYAKKCEREKQYKEEQARKSQALANMIITSGFNFDGYTITKYSGYISGDDVIQVARGTAGFFGAGTATNTGEALSDSLKQLRRNALTELKEAAYDLGCNAVIGVDFDYMTLDPVTANANGGTTFMPYVFCVTANGNAVIIEKNED